MRNNAKPQMLNRICAHPVIISCTLGACAFDAAFCYSLCKAPLRDIAPNWLVTPYLVVVVVSASSLLGCFFGMFACWPLIRIICSRVNGSPLKPGDQVMVLSGHYKGIKAEVSEITRGQGGWDLAILNLDARNIFEEYSLLRIKRYEQRGAVNRNQSGETIGSHSENE